MIVALFLLLLEWPGGVRTTFKMGESIAKIIKIADLGKLPSATLERFTFSYFLWCLLPSRMIQYH